jgi:hypothetical protein
MNCVAFHRATRIIVVISGVILGIAGFVQGFYLWGYPAADKSRGDIRSSRH